MTESGLYVDKFYEMDPAFEDLIPGLELRDGMIVLLEDHMMRGDIAHRESPYDISRLKEINQWCEVSGVAVVQRGHDCGYSPLVKFLGLYPDGVKRPRTYDASYYWIVKKASL